MQIKIKTRDVYGQTLCYPICEKAVIFSKMLGTKTLTRNALELLNQAGIGVSVINEDAPAWVKALTSHGETIRI